MASYERDVFQQVVILGEEGRSDRLLKHRMIGEIDTNEATYTLPDHTNHKIATFDTEDAARNLKRVKLDIFNYNVMSKFGRVFNNDLKRNQIALVCIDLSKTGVVE